MCVQDHAVGKGDQQVFAPSFHRLDRHLGSRATLPTSVHSKFDQFTSDERRTQFCCVVPERVALRHAGRLG